MNEQLKQIKEQCWVEKQWDNEKQLWIDRHVDLNKFAELIVGQMLSIADAHTEVFQTDRDRALIKHIKQSVKTHFGIER